MPNSYANNFLIKFDWFSLFAHTQILYISAYVYGYIKYHNSIKLWKVLTKADVEPKIG